MTRKKQQQKKKKSKTQKKHAKSHVVPHHQKPLNKKTPPKSETAAEQIETNTFEQIDARGELLPPACIGIVEPDEAQSFSRSNQNDVTIVTSALQAEVEDTGQAEELPESSAISLEHPIPTLIAEKEEPKSIVQPSRLVYDRDFLLRFQPLCKERLPTMPSLETIYGSTKSFQPKPKRLIKPKPYHDHGENKPEKTMPGNRFEDWRAKKAPEADKEDDSSLPTAWKPSRRRSQQSDTEAILHEVKGTLNKLTETNFAELSVAVRDSIQSPEVQSGVVDLIFAKALQEPGFASLYARLCRFLDTSYRKSSPTAPGTITTFKTVLLNKCQQNFEEREKREEATTEEATEKERRKTIGNVVFIGELYKETLLPDIVMHICIKTLLGISNIQEKKMVKKAGERLTADLEALCVLLSTIGPVFDRKGTDEEGYFGLMRQMSSNTDIPSRIRCKLLDVLELRARHWKPKRR